MQTLNVSATERFLLIEKGLRINVVFQELRILYKVLWLLPVHGWVNITRDERSKFYTGARVSYVFIAHTHKENPAVYNYIGGLQAHHYDFNRTKMKDVCDKILRDHRASTKRHK